MQQKVNVGEMEINPEKLDIVLHSAALFALLKAKANSLLRSSPAFPSADAVLYARCAADAVTLAQLAKCVVPLIRARDQLAEFGAKGREEKRQLKTESAKGETDWMGWPHRLGKWLLDKIVQGDDGLLTGRDKSTTEGWKRHKSEGQKWAKRQKSKKENAKKAKKAMTTKGMEANSAEQLKSIIRRRTADGQRERRKGRSAKTSLMENIAKLRRIQHFFEMVEHCNRHLGRMGEANSDFLSQLPANSAGDPSADLSVRSVRFLSHPSQLDSLADELQRILHNFTFNSLPILSPRILSLLPEAKTADDGPNLLSPTLFSFHNEGIFSLPSLFGLISTNESDLVELLDLIMDLAGASRVLDKIEAQIAPRQSIVEKELYPKVLKLENLERKWQMVSKTFSEEQKRHLREFGYTLMRDSQFRSLYGRTKKDLRVMDESKLEADILRIAQIEDGQKWRKMGKREAPTEADLLFRLRAKSSLRESEALPEMSPFLFTNKLRQGPVAVNGAVLAPRAFFTSLSSPTFMTISLLSPVAFASSVMSPRAMATSILSPTAFTANVLNPSALWNEVLSPKFFHTNVLSPRALAALVLSPRTMLGEVLSPKLIEARVLNPGTFFIGVLGPNILQPRVLSPSNFGITVLNPNILSPSILSKGNFTVQVLSPSIMSDDVSPDQFLRGQWQNASKPSPAGG
ncbi:hypothetical protein niasHT_007790 [Heterodera trifolii]|uniref:Uncharacterized protein n=1 Tax=Heterodera trifolii TaxID=157864 RepID=A0ABD2LKM9_9BILA